ncbi:MAG: hypothetical protein K5Q68_21440, partial [Roseococcus sp.]|nr:hypothetical protein [Roseococcus sp.]
MRRAALGLWLCLVAAPAVAQERVAVRTGDHPGHGRIVFDWAAPPAYQLEQEGERVVLRFPNADAIDLGGARRLPRNVLAVARVPGGVELTLRPGARIRHFRNGPKVALDVLDPSETREAEAPPAPRRPAREAAPSPAPNARPAATRGAPPAPSPSPGPGSAATPSAALAPAAPAPAVSAPAAPAQASSIQATPALAAPPPAPARAAAAPAVAPAATPPPQPAAASAPRPEP